MVKEVLLTELADSLDEGETAFIAGSSGEPRELTQLLVEQTDRAKDVRFITSFVPGINSRNLAVIGTSRRMQVFFMQPNFRVGRADGCITFSPLSYYGIQQYLSQPATRIDTAIVQVSEPDPQGQCSLGPAVEFMPAVLNSAQRVFAVINPRVPRLPGSMSLPMERFEQLARSQAPLAEYDAGGSNPVTDRIVAHLAALIPNGATIQIGIGKVPAQLLPALRAHRELAFHSGMLSDAMLGLTDSGCLRPGPSLTAAVVVGSSALYTNLAGVPRLRLEGVGHTHNPEVLARTPRLYAVNSALEVDLLGQVNAEMLGGRYVGGPGGLPDFAAAARRNPAGLSIIALPSTDPKGQVSRIVAQFAAGTPVAVPQHDVDAVVTEHGLALLRGIDLDERMKRLIGVAHPDHRPGLEVASCRLLANT